LACEDEQHLDALRSNTISTTEALVSAENHVAI
jgi:hypothetical protein